MDVISGRVCEQLPALHPAGVQNALAVQRTYELMVRVASVRSITLTNTRTLRFVASWWWYILQREVIPRAACI
jgi:hypothetical protein